jgi:hypothetical protein
MPIGTRRTLLDGRGLSSLDTLHLILICLTASTANEKARDRLICLFDWDCTIPEQALGYRFDVILSGREATPMEA